MKTTKMICEYCGKEFYSEYYTGGYIDHYTNFSSHKSRFGKDIEHDVREICYFGNDLRKDNDIQERLECYLKWDNVPDNMKIAVKEKCDFLINKIKSAQKKAESIVKGMTMLERKFLIEEAECNCSKPYGNEDGKLWK